MEQDEQQTNAVVPHTAQTDMMIARQAQEVQVAMLSAKRFPRDEVTATARIKATCQRSSLAEQAIYTYPRGGQKVSGPSIRLAEAIAQNWGNIEAGVIELDNKDGKSEMMAYAWDLETNTRVAKIFSVEHKRDTKQGSKILTDGRDIYEATANFGARRMRACILSVVPGDVVEMAVIECKKTLADKDQRPVEEIVSSLIKTFKELGVSKEQLEQFVGKPLTKVLKEELVDLRGVYKAINDGQAKVTDYFKPLQTSEEDKAKIKEDAKAAAAKLKQEAEGSTDGQATPNE
jgi:hypothetical protein